MATIHIDKKNKQFDKDYSTKSYDIARRMFKEYIHPEIKMITVAILCLLIIAFSTAINAWLMQPVLDDVFMKQKNGMLFLIPIALFVNSIVKGIAEFYQSSSMKIIGQRIVANVQKKLYIHLIHSDMKFFHDNSTGNLLSKFMNEINVMKRSITEVFIGTVRDCITLVALIGLMFYQSWSMSLIFMLVFPIMFFPVIKLGKKMRRTARKIQNELSTFAVRLDETFKNISVIKSFCKEKYEINRAEQALNDVVNSYKKSAYIESTVAPMMEVAGGITISLAIWYGGISVLDHSLTPGEFFSFITALLMCYRPLKSVSQLNTLLQEGLAAAQRLFEVMDQEILIKNCNNVKQVTIKSYEIVFENVCFSYKKCRKGVLNNLNMTIKSGQTVALVGTSGVGKSTILQLLQRFYDADKGRILIDGYDIKQIPLKQLRNSIALVSQDTAMFDETIDYNIRYGRMMASHEEIIEASKAAAAHDFIVNMPDEYATHVGQAGLKISSGQKQRIAIARAILKDAPILLLDEATSALDAVSETKVQHALNNLKKGRTTIIIAHRLSTIESADLIYVISDGKAAEFGTHKELLNKSERYSKLYSHYKNSTKR